MAEMREWIEPKSGRFPKNGEKVLVLITVRYRDPFFERDHLLDMMIPQMVKEAGVTE